VDERQASWLFTGIHGMDPLMSFYVVFENNQKEAIGYLDWKTFYKSCNYGEGGTIHKNQLQTNFDTGICLFPWELLDSDDVIPPTTTNYLMTWNHQKNWEEIHKLDALESRLSESVITKPNECALRVIVAVVDYLFALKNNVTIVEGQSLLRIDTEYQQFWRDVQFVSEDHVVSFLNTNGLDVKSMIVTPTTLDLQTFALKHDKELCKGPTHFPKVVFVVPYEECYKLPIYAGLMSHLTWMDIKEWLWQKQYDFLHSTIPKRIYTELEGNINHVDQFRDKQFKQLLSLRSKEQHKRQKFNTNNKPEYVVVDIEDLISHKSPPCIAELVQRKIHLKDQQRIQLAYQLRSGNVALESVVTLFDEKQWNPKSVWEKGYIGCTCEQILDNTKQRRKDTIWCPVNSTTMCLNLFKQKHPTKYHSGKILKRPYQWYLWTLSE
jgi:hypothetical protein